MNELTSTGWNDEPTLTEEGLDMRYQAMARQLDLVIGETHPRLSDPAQRTTIGDLSAASLRYGDIVQFTPTLESPELPDQAVKCTDPRAVITLMEFHIARVIDYLKQNRRSTAIPRELAGFPVIEYQDAYSDGTAKDNLRWLHPQVEGYYWYRGLKIEIDKDTALHIFQPWMFHSSIGGAPFPMMYKIGEPTAQQLQDISFAYGSS